MFAPGTVYRRTELHDRYGGQRFGGISTFANHPMVWLFSGVQGELYGYHDGFREDGTYWYTGEGQIGEMKMIRGNAAIHDHRTQRKALHLFEYVHTGRVRYIGEASYAGHHSQVAPDREGNPRNVIVFELALSYTGDAIDSRSPSTAQPPKLSAMWKQPLGELRKLAAHRPASDATPIQRKTNAFTRSHAVRIYVIRRAKGQCEGCDSPAPFSTREGQPYLEAHHLRRRADGGPDHPRWVIALCPNCHRRVHHGKDGEEYNRALMDRVALIESSYEGTESTESLAMA